MKIDKTKKYRGVQAYQLAKKVGYELSKHDRKGLVAKKNGPWCFMAWRRKKNHPEGGEWACLWLGACGGFFTTT